MTQEELMRDKLRQLNLGPNSKNVEQQQKKFAPKGKQVVLKNIGIYKLQQRVEKIDIKKTKQ